MEHIRPRAYRAFGSVATDDDTVLFTFGGLMEGFDSRSTFKEVAESDASDKVESHER